MKRIFCRIAIILSVNILLLTIPVLKSAAHDVAVSYQTFYDELSPYGQWVNDAQYGNVWVPNEEPGYRPYATRGNWVMTDNGNMWVSDAPWGWACYHYGRWTYNPYYGWIWIPGYQWAPAWVSWRSGGGYYGWAPMGPGYNPGGYYNYPDNYWVFVGPQYLYRPNVYGYYEPRYTSTYMSRTTYINETYVDNSRGTTYYYGPRSQEIERETHQPVQVYHVSEAGRPGESMAGNNVSIYRPRVNEQSMATARPANVIRATEPIGKPQSISAEHATTAPAFREVMQKQNPAFKSPNVYNNSGNNQGRQQNSSAAPTSAQPNNQQNVRANEQKANPQQARPNAEPNQNNQQRTNPQAPGNNEPRANPENTQQERNTQQQPNNKPQQPNNRQPRSTQPRSSQPKATEKRH